MPKFFLGAVQATRPDWEMYFSIPTARQSSRPDSVDKEVAKRMEKQRAKAPRVPFSGQPVSLCVLAAEGTKLFEYTASLVDGYSDAAERFVAFLATLGPDPFPLRVATNEDAGVDWFAFDAREVLHQIAVAAMQAGHGPRVPLGAWYGQHFMQAPFVDPYDALVPSSMRDDIGLPAVWEFVFGEPLPTSALDTAYGRAEVARRLCLKTGLVH